MYRNVLVGRTVECVLYGTRNNTVMLWFVVKPHLSKFYQLCWMPTMFTKCGFYTTQWQKRESKKLAVQRSEKNTLSVIYSPQRHETHPGLIPEPFCLRVKRVNPLVTPFPPYLWSARMLDELSLVYGWRKLIWWKRVKCLISSCSLANSCFICIYLEPRSYKALRFVKVNLLM